MDIRDELNRGVLLFDGSMGTYYASLYPDGERVESANRQHPGRVRAIHTAYLEAGARALKTNTLSPFDTVHRGLPPGSRLLLIPGRRKLPV